MAVIKFSENKRQIISHEIAVDIWLILNGEKKGTKEQQKYCENIDKVWLNWRQPDCPESYIVANRDLLAKMGHFV